MRFGKKQDQSAELTGGATVAPRPGSTAATPEAAAPKGQPARPAGKGRPTPKRRDAEAANRRPLVTDHKAMTAEQKAAQRAERARVREAMMRGEERYLPPRDKGPERRYLRDAVDVRWNIGEVLLPVMLVLLVLTLMPLGALQRTAFLAVYIFMLMGFIDCWLLWRRTKRRFTEEFGHEPGRGSAFYVVARSFQMRRTRIPRPAVERGAELQRRR